MSDSEFNSVENFQQVGGCVLKKNCNNFIDIECDGGSSDDYCFADTKDSKCYSNQECKAKGCDKFHYDTYNGGTQ